MSTGRIVWHELMTTDVEKAKGFYAGLLGWEIEVWKPGEMDYPMISANGQQHGGFQKLDPGTGAPSHWLAHATVESADEAARRAEKGGGKVLLPPANIPEVGRFTVISDPQGAAISAFAPQGEEPASEGVFLWDELLTTDVEGARRFYGDVFGWTTAEMDMGEMGVYTLFRRDGETDTAGLMRKPDQDPSPPHWLTYLATADVDASVKKAEGLGAVVFMTGMDIPNVGRIAVLADSTGAAFGLFQPRR